MAHIQWKDRYNINFREIDAQHHGLLDLLNELIDLLDDRSHPDQVSRIFRDLGDYAFTHFSSEERYMEAAKYPKLPQHRLEHEGFVARILQLSQSFDLGDPHLVDHTLDFLKHWYLDHITRMDQDYIPFLKQALPTVSIEAILFGLDAVICTRDLGPLVQRVAELASRPEAQVRTALLEDPGLLRHLQTGAWDPIRFEVELAAWADAPIQPGGVIEAYGKGFQPVPALLQLAHKLKAHQPVALVGNAAPWLITHRLPTASLHAPFSVEAFSCEVGAELPDRGIFLRAATQLGLPPEACLLVHADAACLDAAQSIHMQTLHYTRPVMLMAELRHMGISF